MAEKNNDNVPGLAGYLERLHDTFKQHADERNKAIEESLGSQETVAEPEDETVEIVDVECTEELVAEIPDEWVDDESDSEDAEELQDVEGMGSSLSIDLSKKPATEITARAEAEAELENEGDGAEGLEDVEVPDETADTAILPSIEQTTDDEHESECLGIDDYTDDDFTSPLEELDDEVFDDYIEHEEYLRETDELLGEELIAIVESEDYEIDPDIASNHARNSMSEDKTEEDDEELIPHDMISGIGESSYDITWSKIPAIYDARGMEICLGDEMAYRNDYRGIGPVIGIGKDCFFTLAMSTATGNAPKNALGEVERQQWDLLDSDGNKREFYHYNPDTIERLTALIYNEDYDIDDLLDRFRQFISKERRELKQR